MRVVVKAEHVRDGRKTAPHDCALALAVAEACPGMEVTVFHYSVSITSRDAYPHEREDFYIPGRRALALISAFDTGKLKWETTPDETTVYLWPKNRVTEWLHEREPGWTTIVLEKIQNTMLFKKTQGFLRRFTND